MGYALPMRWGLLVAVLACGGGGGGSDAGQVGDAGEPAADAGLPDGGVFGTPKIGSGCYADLECPHTPGVKCVLEYPLIPGSEFNPGACIGITPAACIGAACSDGPCDGGPAAIYCTAYCDAGCGTRGICYAAIGTCGPG